MARKNRHNAAFVVGAVVGGLAGAAAALWKTPYSGEELRAKITGNGDATTEDAARVETSTADSGMSMKDKLLSTVENALAPIVGVELGKTANDSGPSANGEAETTTSMGAGAGHRPDASTAPSSASFGSAANTEPPAYPSDEPGLRTSEEGVPQENVTPVDQDGGEPSDLSPSSGAPESTAATVEDLTTPQIDDVPDALQEEEGQHKPFPKLGGTE